MVPLVSLSIFEPISNFQHLALLLYNRIHNLLIKLALTSLDDLLVSAILTPSNLGMSAIYDKLELVVPQHSGDNFNPAK